MNCVHSLEWTQNKIVQRKQTQESLDVLPSVLCFVQIYCTMARVDNYLRRSMCEAQFPDLLTSTGLRCSHHTNQRSVKQSSNLMVDKTITKLIKQSLID